MSKTEQIDINIRLANLDCAPIIAEFTGTMALETEGVELDPEVVLKGVENAMNDEKFGFYIVAQVNEKTVGCLMVTYEWSDWRNGVQWWLQSVYVEPNHRGIGVFNKMFDFVVERAKSEQNVCGIRLYVEKSNTRAISTYRSLGLNPTDYLMFEMPLI